MSETPDAILRRLAREPGRTLEEKTVLLRAATVMAARSMEPPKPPSRKPDYLRLLPIWEWRPGDPGNPPLVTAALVQCAITGKTLSGSGGPDFAIDPNLVPRYQNMPDG